MSPIDGFWHLLNFFAPALFVGVVTASAAKLAWRRSLQAVRWRRLVAWAVLPAAAVALAGLVWAGRDGKTGTYGLMVVACALGVWACFPRKS